MISASAVADHLFLRTGCVFAFVLVSALGHVEMAHADPAIAICGDATGDGRIKSGDAVVTLRGAVGFGECAPPSCDVNESGSVTASDAMLILETAVGQDIALNCPPQAPASTTTSTSTTSTSLGSTCGNDIVEPGEDCEQGFCRGGCNMVTGLCVDLACAGDCTCPEPECGDAILDAGEGCDPPGSACDGGTCSASCACVP